MTSYKLGRGTFVMRILSFLGVFLPVMPWKTYSCLSMLRKATIFWKFNAYAIPQKYVSGFSTKQELVMILAEWCSLLVTKTMKCNKTTKVCAKSLLSLRSLLVRLGNLMRTSVNYPPSLSIPSAFKGLVQALFIHY